MTIRITQQQLNGAFSTDLQSIQARLYETQRQVTTGQRLARPSDDPTAMAQMLGYDTQLVDLDRYQANAANSISMIDTADSALDTVTSALQRVRELTIQAANASTGNNDRAAIATELAQLKGVIQGALNTRHGDVYVFGGTATSVPPFVTNAYTGTATSMTRRVGENQTVAINIAGDIAVGANGSNTLDAIDQLITDVTTNNLAGIQGGITTITAKTDVAIDARTRLGAISARLELVQDRLSRTQERVLQARSDVADVDMADAYMRFTQQQSMYEAALAAGTRIMKTSILDFL